MENQVEKKDRSMIVWIAVLAALVAGVIGLFALLEVVAPDTWDAQIWDDMSTEKGATAAYDLRMLDEEERGGEDIGTWLDHAQDSECAYWLCRQELDEYVLYLPQQDRVILNGDITATEETGEDGETTLVFRIRTPEDSESIDPAEQLFAIQTDSEAWRGLKVKVILDGREKTVQQNVWKDGELYTTDEWYIGRF